jgi:hypothetical protein
LLFLLLHITLGKPVDHKKHSEIELLLNQFSSSNDVG